MTPDTLRSLLTGTHDLMDVATAFADVDETTRKSLSKPVQDLYREARKEEQAEQWGGSKPFGSRTRLAMLACCPLTQAKRVHGDLWSTFGNMSRTGESIVKVLTDHRPDWADQWIEFILNETNAESRSFLTWTDIRKLMAAGVIQRPMSDGYIQMMVLHRDHDFDIEQDADLLEHEVWRLFEIDTLAFDWMPPLKDIDRTAWAARPRDPRKENDYNWFADQGWPRTLFHLSEQGHLDRGRLINAGLSAFWRDFRGPVRTGMLRYHELLAPTDDEITERQNTYRELLRCEQGPVVTMSLKMLGRLHKAGRLDVAEFLDTAPAVFAIPNKAQPKSALTLIDRVLKKADAHRKAGIAAIGVALNHESPDIQEKAVEILAKYKAADDSLNLAEVVESATMIVPQHRQHLEDLVGDSTTDLPCSTGQGDTLSVGQLNERETSLLQRMAALPQWVREATCVNGMESALRQEKMPQVFDPSPTTCPMLTGVEPLAAVGNVDELIDLCQRLLAGSGEPEDQERVVDGILRLGHQTTDNFDAKTEGLRATIKSRLELAGAWYGGAVLWEMNALPLIIGRWLQLAEVADVVRNANASPQRSLLGELSHVLSKRDIEDVVKNAQASAHNQMTPLDWRLAELFKRLDRGEFGPVLSTPTHRSGWIDPRRFVERLNDLYAAGIAIGKRDFIGGLLRLAPENRDTALSAAGDLGEPHGRIVRYALGADEVPSRRDRKLADEWLAAGRARNPRGELTELSLLKLSPNEPDGVTPATYKIWSEADPTELKYSRWSTGHSSRYVSVKPDQPGKDAAQSRPTVALPARLLGTSMFSFVDDARQYQLASIAPLNTDSTLALAAVQLMFRIDDKGSVWEPVTGVMSPLLDVDRPWSDIARVALWIGLLSRDDHARGIAVDALIEGIIDGRADVERLSETLLQLVRGSWMKLNRLADSLREVSRTSVLTEFTVSSILDRLIASWDTLPRDGHHVLSLQIELLSSLHSAPSEAAREVLQMVKGSGKAAKLARQISVLTVDPDSRMIRQAILEAAEGRLARAERIARGNDESNCRHTDPA